MHLRTFTARTMAEALQQVKSTMGGDAVILHTRTYSKRRWLGLRRQEIVEVTVGTGLQVARGARPASGPTKPSNRTPAPRRAITPAAPASLAPANATAGAQALLQTPAAGNAVIMSLSREMDELKSMLKGLVHDQRRQRAPDVPENLFEHYLNLIQNQVAEELARDVVRSIQTSVRPEHLHNGDFVRDKLAEHLEKMLPVAGPICRTKTTGAHVVALIGPTGVGKTTTVAKLAANLKLREHQRVGLITIDTYRIAAVDQLKKYADIIGAPLRVVSSPEELRAAIAAMQDQDYILIDTAGRAPSDTIKLGELKNFLEQAKPDEVHLVLSTTASQACIEAAVARFSEVRVDKIIFTKLDEAVHVGVVLNVVRKVNKALSYITTGQDVPYDIEVGRGRRLAQLILGNNLGSSI